MSPRRNHSSARRTDGAGDGTREGGRYGGFETTETHQGEEWSVRHVAGGDPGKSYRCPGCDQTISSQMPHVVAWPQYSGVDERRHWHKACWNARDRRTSRVQRSRNAPRY